MLGKYILVKFIINQELNIGFVGKLVILDILVCLFNPFVTSAGRLTAWIIIICPQSWSIKAYVDFPNVGSRYINNIALSNGAIEIKNRNPSPLN